MLCVDINELNHISVSLVLTDLPITVIHMYIMHTFSVIIEFCNLKLDLLIEGDFWLRGVRLG